MECAGGLAGNARSGAIRSIRRHAGQACLLLALTAALAACGSPATLSPPPVALRLATQRSGFEARLRRVPSSRRARMRLSPDTPGLSVVTAFDPSPTRDRSGVDFLHDLSIDGHSSSKQVLAVGLALGVEPDGKRATPSERLAQHKVQAQQVG